MNERFNALFDHDITLGINLAPTSHYAYKNILQQIAGHREQCIRYMVVDLPHHSTASIGVVKQALDVIDEERRNRGRVYIHATPEMNYAGLLAACYLIRHGYPSEQALRHLAEIQKHIPERYKSLPTTYTHMNFIRKWKSYDPPRQPSPFQDIPDASI
ncbi:protein-tyrosine phosphatase family protein [Poriferisphaera corsica]|uniref:dual specificity protein phosphatase family protein n=1 Tax=Poriferisphaera corsica TaxID=2528020 RepID=UPI00190DB39A|nr:dual specificity protein phosphatase family protein [Poriferisphaera corsica]